MAEQSDKPGPANRRKLVAGAIGVVVVVVLLVFGIPWVREMLSTVDHRRRPT